MFVLCTFTSLVQTQDPPYVTSLVQTQDLVLAPIRNNAMAMMAVAVMGLQYLDYSVGNIIELVQHCTDAIETDNCGRVTF